MTMRRLLMGSTALPSVIATWPFQNTRSPRFIGSFGARRRPSDICMSLSPGQGRPQACIESCTRPEQSSPKREFPPQRYGVPTMPSATATGSVAQSPRARKWRSGANAFTALAKAIRALATEDAIAEVARLRAERDSQKRDADKWFSQALENRHEIERLAAELAAANAREAKAAAIAKRLAYWLDTDAEVLADMGARDMSDHQHITEEVRLICAALAQPSTEGQE